MIICGVGAYVQQGLDDLSNQASQSHSIPRHAASCVYIGMI